MTFSVQILCDADCEKLGTTRTCYSSGCNLEKLPRGTAESLTDASNEASSKFAKHKWVILQDIGHCCPACHKAHTHKKRSS